MVMPPAFRSRPFTLYWAGQLISIAGSQMQLWALYWHLRKLSDQPMVISGIGLARFLPIILLSLLAGVAADHLAHLEAQGIVADVVVHARAQARLLGQPRVKLIPANDAQDMRAAQRRLHTLAAEIQARCDIEGDRLPDHIRDFVEIHVCTAARATGAAAPLPADAI